jgi:hypothetical protein
MVNPPLANKTLSLICKRTASSTFSTATFSSSF